MSEGRYSGLLVPAQPDLAAEGFPCRGWLVLAPLLVLGFTLPGDACNTFRALYAQLQELESDLHMHIHLENNILFPRASELESRLLKAWH